MLNTSTINIPNPAKRDDVDKSRRIVPAPAKDYWPYAGISGAGAPVTPATETGGWGSGLPNVRYQGPKPPAYLTLPWGDYSTGSAVTKRLLPPLKPLWDVHIRDTIICLGGDGNY